MMWVLQRPEICGFGLSQEQRFLGEYTKMLAPGGIDDETLTYTIKNNLTKNIGTFSLVKIQTLT
jgi:hypothetical protein